MHARVATFEGDSSRIDNLVGTIRERMSAGDEIPGAKRFLMLIDREGGMTLGITFFDSEDAIQAAEPIFDKMGDEVPEKLRGRRTSVETYEVAVDDIAGSARAARVSTLEGSPEGIEKGIAFINETILPEAADLTGWRGMLTLADRTSGKAKTITFWDTQETLRASEARGNELRAQAAEAMGDTITSVERYEVALNEVPAAV
ncbi:MAG: hypothetical protein M3364_03655 [Actinomycetota bacterium]|nr:hypothetical protein [Actinomycetota bacterium]